MIKRKLTRFIAAALAVSLLWQNVSQACPNGPGFLRTMAYTEREEGVDLNAREPVRIIKLSNGEELAVFPMDKSFAHDADYSQKIINVRNLIPGADWDVEDLSSAFDTYKRNRIHRFSFVLVNEQSDIVGLIIAYERDRIKADNAIPEGKDGPHLYIQSLSIKDDERYRRKGLAQKLIECSIESYAERKKASRLSELNVAIQSYQQNTPACTLYGEKMGFELIGTRTYDFVPEPSNPYYENFKGKWVDNVYFASAKDLLIKKPMAKVSHFFEERRVLAVATSAILKAIGVVVVGFATQAIHPAQITFWVYAFDFIIISGILFILGFYKSSSGKPLGIFRDITRTWRILNNRHKAHLGIFSFFYLAASLGTYFVFPHVTSAMIMILMQMSLATALPLTVLILGERKGWSRKLISLGIIVALVSFMAFFESMANPAFLRNISWIVKGVFIGSLWGIPAVILRKIFQEIRHPDKEGRSFYKEHEKRRILPFMPGMVILFNYAACTPVLAALPHLFGSLGLFGLHGAASSVFTMAMLNPGVFLPVVISSFFFVASLLFDWKLSRMTGYDLSKIAIAASSAPMIAALMSLGLKALFGIGGVPFSSALSWIAPVGVIAAAYYSSLNDEEPSSDGEFTLAGGEKVSVRALNKTHIREYAPEITEAMNWIAGINWDVRDLYEVWNDTQRQHSFLAFDAQEEIVGIVFAFERNFIDVDVPAEIGTGIFTISASRDNLLIHSLAVREGYRRQGLAQHLILSAVDNYTKSNPHVDPGQLFVTIHAKKGDAAANKLYGEKLGFNALGAHIYDSEETADGKINTGQKREFIAYIAPASQLLGSQLLGSVSQGAASQEDVLFAEPGLQEAELLMRVFQGVENRTKSLAEPSELQAAI